MEPEEIEEMKKSIEECADELKAVLEPLIRSKPSVYYAMAMCFLSGGIMASYKNYQGNEEKTLGLAGKMFVEGAENFLKFRADRRRKQQ